MPQLNIKELLQKYLKGKVTPEEEKLIEDWYTSLGDENKHSLDESEKVILRKNYWEALKVGINPKKQRSIKFWAPLTSVAAAITLILVAFFSFLSRDSRPIEFKLSTKNIVSVEIINDTQRDSVITLNDGSEVTLSPQARMAVLKDFNVNERRISLSGKAFFEITHDAEKPFYVVANEVVTKVLGTSFMVKAMAEEEEIIVAVKTGKVSVFTSNDDKIIFQPAHNVVLTPNQQAIYNRNEKRVIRMLVNDPQVIIPENEVQLEFKKAPVTDIFAALEKMYGVDVVYDSLVFQNCKLTTSIKGKNLYERVQIICEAIGATYLVEDARVFIQSKGCN